MSDLGDLYVFQTQLDRKDGLLREARRVLLLCAGYLVEDSFADLHASAVITAIDAELKRSAAPVASQPEREDR